MNGEKTADCKFPTCGTPALLYGFQRGIRPARSSVRL